ncbi:pyrimidine 5'-nucleotidase [Xanthobacter versatilis]|uniref:pyrimidine 5'-nucleotidase n=1 Tax=Xanthobacter autotrophicus (strain ATCC BAA-1158 / Py2) TaxID=78245 RepID=UPI003728A55E
MTLPVTNPFPDTSSSAFDAVDTWVFDLDNTLYPAHHDLWFQIDARMKGYISDLLGIPPDDAFRIQKDYYRRYGTSLRGLMIEHGVEPDAFLAHVHDVDLSGLDASPRLAAAIEALPGAKIVYTNGSERHARNVLEKLGIDAHFAAVHDIVAAEFHPKPTEEAYLRFLRAHGVDPTRSAMFEDLARNLEVPHRLGMVTVLVVPPDETIAARETWEFEGREDAYVDHITEDLAGFLETVARTAPPPVSEPD